MALDPKAFKAYDVRGIYPSELDEAGAYAVGRAYVEQFEPKASRSGATCASVSVDGRGGHAGGRRRRRRGQGHRDDRHRDALFRRRRARPRRRRHGHRLAQPEGVHGDEDRPPRRAPRRRRFGPPRHPRPGTDDRRAPSSEPAPAESVDIYPAFVERVLSFIDVEEIKPLRVVIDAGNGMAGAMLPPILERLPVDAVRCFFEPDGTFPNHAPNPLLPENREFIVGKVKEEQADLGIAFDGDADRCFFVDDTGEFVPGDFVTALLAESHAREGARREDHLRRAGELGGARHRRAARRHAARQPGRPRLHQGAHAQGGRALRRRGLRPLLLPRLQPGRLRDDSRAPHARARLQAREAAFRASSGPSASATSSPARSTRPCRTSPSSCRS